MSAVTIAQPQRRSFIDTCPDKELFAGLARLLRGETIECKICGAFARHRTCERCMREARNACSRRTYRRAAQCSSHTASPAVGWW